MIYGHDSGELHDLLVKDSGLGIFDADGHGPISRSEFVDLFEKPMWNYLAKR